MGAGDRQGGAAWSAGPDEELIGLCAEFMRHAEARTTEGDRLDGLPWSKAVNAGYLELSRGSHDHQALLDRILAAAPATVAGLVAKARVIGRHQQDHDAEQIPATILADDVLRVCGGQTAGSGARSRAGGGQVTESGLTHSPDAGE
jgi:hypothetical protein